MQHSNPKGYLQVLNNLYAAKTAIMGDHAMTIEERAYQANILYDLIANINKASTVIIEIQNKLSETIINHIKLSEYLQKIDFCFRQKKDLIAAINDTATALNSSASIKAPMLKDALHILEAGLARLNQEFTQLKNPIIESLSIETSKQYLCELHQQKKEMHTHLESSRIIFSSHVERAQVKLNQLQQEAFLKLEAALLELPPSSEANTPFVQAENEYILGISSPSSPSLFTFSRTNSIPLQSHQIPENNSPKLS